MRREVLITTYRLFAGKATYLKIVCKRKLPPTFLGIGYHLLCQTILKYHIKQAITHLMSSMVRVQCTRHAIAESKQRLQRRRIDVRQAAGRKISCRIFITTR
jgi:hypothetical protein